MEGVALLLQSLPTPGERHDITTHQLLLLLLPAPLGLGVLGRQRPRPSTGGWDLATSVHVAHAAHAGGRRPLGLGRLDDDALGGGQQAGNRGRVQERGTDHLRVGESQGCGWCVWGGRAKSVGGESRGCAGGGGGGGGSGGGGWARKDAAFNALHLVRERSGGGGAAPTSPPPTSKAPSPRQHHQPAEAPTCTGSITPPEPQDAPRRPNPSQQNPCGPAGAPTHLTHPNPNTSDTAAHVARPVQHPHQYSTPTSPSWGRSRPP